MAAHSVPVCYRHRDRETYLSCSSCGRPICGECATVTNVGQRCPECAGEKQRVQRPASMSSVQPVVTYAIVAINVLMFFVIEGGLSGGLGGVPIDRLVKAGALVPVLVADGEVWRIATSMVLHASLLHLFFNMWGIWIFGPIVEARFGGPALALLYVACGFSGAAGASLLSSPVSVTVGASGALFGMLAAIAVSEWRVGGGRLGGAGMVLGMNLLLTFAIPGISIGGHLGGLAFGLLIGFAAEALLKRGGRRLLLPMLVVFVVAGGAFAIAAAERAVS